MISVTRLGGTLIWRASSVGVTPSPDSSSARISWGEWRGAAWLSLPSVVVYDFAPAIHAPPDQAAAVIARSAATKQSMIPSDPPAWIGFAFGAR